MVLAYCNLEQDRSGNVRSVKLPGGLVICKFNSSRPSDEVLLHEALIKPPLILTVAFNRTKVDLLSTGCQKQTWKSQLTKYKISSHENLLERVRNIDQFAEYSIHYKKGAQSWYFMVFVCIMENTIMIFICIWYEVTKVGHCPYNNKLEIVDQWSTRIPPPHRRVWHCSKSQGSHFESDIADNR